MQTLFNFADPTTARSSLFMSTNGEPFTTSRAIAERFGKRHKNVLKRIKNLQLYIDDCGFNVLQMEHVNDQKTNQQDHNKPPFSRIYFEPRDYLDVRGKKQLEYRISHDGFGLLAMGFTGKEALVWKIAFLTAFNQMEAEVKTIQQRYAKVLDIVRPSLRPVTEATEHGEGRASIAAIIGKSVNAVTYHRRKARQFGLLGNETLLFPLPEPTPTL